MSAHEQALLAQCPQPTLILPQSEIVVMVPQDWPAKWHAEAGIHDLDGLSSWLNAAYVHMRQWTGVDPNQNHYRRTGERNRLAFAATGKGDFVFRGEARPYVGLRNGRDPLFGSEDWVGWLCHELSHDFFHDQHFNVGRTEWGEGMCDYSRYHLLRELGLKVAAENWEKVLLNGSPRDKYKGPAKLLLLWERNQRLSGPAALWRRIRKTDFDLTVGRSSWNI